MQRRNLLLNPRGRVVLKLRVVLMQSGGRAGCRRVLEVHLLEVLLGKRMERLPRAIGGGMLSSGGEHEERRCKGENGACSKHAPDYREPARQTHTPVLTWECPNTSILHHTGMQMPRLTALVTLGLLLLASTALTGCVVAGATSTGHFFLFPGIGLIVLILIVLLVLRRR